MSAVFTKQNYISMLPLNLREDISERFEAISIEFHDALLKTLQRFSDEDCKEFSQLWSKVPDEMNLSFIAFIISGDDPDGKFLAHLDKDENCQKAVDLAFRTQIDSLHNFGRSVEKAEVAMQKNRLIREADKAEDALEYLEERLESMSKDGVTTATAMPVLKNIREAITALGGSKQGIKELAR